MKMYDSLVVAFQFAIAFKMIHEYFLNLHINRPFDDGWLFGGNLIGILIYFAIYKSLKCSQFAWFGNMKSSKNVKTIKIAQ